MAHNLGTLLDQRKMRAIGIIAAGGSQSEAARVAGVSAACITQWLKDDDFRGELEEISKDARCVVVRMARSLFDAAMASVSQGIKDDPRLALQYLKETGALSQIGRQLGMVSSDEGATVQVVINTGVSAPIEVKALREAEVIDASRYNDDREANAWPVLGAIGNGTEGPT
jgi:hypothetical protein